MVNGDRLRRLSLTLSAAAESVGRGQAAGSADTLVASYNQLREEVRSALPPGFEEEFDERFEELAEPRDNAPAAEEQTGTTGEVQEALRRMAGWVQGVLEEQQ